MPNHTCLHCGTVFYNKRSQARFCNRQCWEASCRIELTCLECGKRFTRRKHRFSKSNCGDRPNNRAFCSVGCLRAHEARDGKPFARKRIFVKCAECGHTFEEHEKTTRKYCSSGCFHAANARNRSTRIKKTCERCGTVFETLPSRVKHGWGRFCSLSCWGVANCLSQDMQSGVERQFFDDLGLFGVSLQRQVPIGKYVVDGYDPLSNTVVEFDGQYWHSRPDVITKDHRKDGFLRSRGFGLIRVNEQDFKTDRLSTIGSVITALIDRRELDIQ